MSQYVHALTASEAQIAIDHLQGLIEGLNQKVTQLQHIKREASQQAVELEEPKVFYSYANRAPSEDLLTALVGMRVGKIRRVDRFIQVDPVFAARISKAAADPMDAFRFTNSEETAKGVLSLHSLL